MSKPLYFSSKRGSCDCCGKTRNLTFVCWTGIDTYACAECRGGDLDDDDLTDGELDEMFGDAP